MNYGWRALSLDLPGLTNGFSQIRVSRALSEPHIYIAFYMQIPPKDYQQASRLWTDFNQKGYLFLDQYDGYTLGKFRFGNIYPQDPVQVPTLYIGRPSDFGSTISPLLSIKFPDGQPAIYAAAVYP